MSEELQLFAQEIQSFLSPNTLRDFARDIGFVQRISKYQAKDLVASCVWMSQNVVMNSLTQLSSCLEVLTEILISPEGLNQRFNKAAVQFSQHILAELPIAIFASIVLVHETVSLLQWFGVFMPQMLIMQKKRNRL